MALFFLIAAFLLFSFVAALFLGSLLRRHRESEEIEQWYVAVLLDTYEESKTGKSTYTHRQRWEHIYRDSLISADSPHQREIIRPMVPPYKEGAASHEIG